VPAADEHGVIVSSSWKDIYPNEYRTYLDNDKNFPPKEEYAEVTAETPDTTTPDVSNYSLEQADEKANYIADDQYPEIKILGKGYGYAKYYTEPAGHTFSLWSIKNNGRVSEKSKAQCITCKTPQFLYDVQGYTDVNGNKVDPKIDWTDPFYETLDTYDENIACANCHVNNDPTQLQVSFMGQTRRKKQREAVRLLARNKPIEWKCAKCGAPAELVDVEDMFGEEPSCYCKACAEKSEVDMDMTLPITNSPRMGVCAYTGELDKYQYTPEKFKKGAAK
jgi:formate-dependent nitrite reductase cytochrome c552 subunit